MPSKTNPALDALLTSMAREAVHQGEAVDRAMQAFPMTGCPTDEERRRYREGMLNLYKSRRKIARAASRSSASENIKAKDSEYERLKQAQRLAIQSDIDSTIPILTNGEVKINKVPSEPSVSITHDGRTVIPDKLFDDVKIEEKSIFPKVSHNNTPSIGIPVESSANDLISSTLVRLINAVQANADAVQAMIGSQGDLIAAKDATIETQRRLIERLERLVGAA